MKNCIRKLVLFALLAVCFSMSSCSSLEEEELAVLKKTAKNVLSERKEIGSYDDFLYEVGEEILYDYCIDANSSYKVNYQNSIYDINIDGDNYKIEIVMPSINEEIFDGKGEKINSQKIKRLFYNSKGIVIDYIKKSKVLEGKKDLVQKILKVPMEYGNIENTNTAAIYQNGVIYVNKNAPKNGICEWLFVHELIHYLSDITHGDNVEDYQFSLYVEVMTDLITFSLDPEIDNEIYSSYSEYYEYILPYIGKFKEEAIKAYFYDHEKIWKKTSKNKFDLYVLAIEHISDFFTDEIPFQFLIIKNTFNEWANL